MTMTHLWKKYVMQMLNTMVFNIATQGFNPMTLDVKAPDKHSISLVLNNTIDKWISLTSGVAKDQVMKLLRLVTISMWRTNNIVKSSSH